MNLPIQRADRYSGDQMSATLSDLRAPDQVEVRRLYAQVEEAQARLLRSVESSVLPAGIAAEVAGLPLWSEIVDTTRRVNAGGSGYDERMRRVLHDVRGGSLTALLGTAQMLPYSGSLLNDLHRCAYYARDHLKIVRNCLPEIDPVAAARDQVTRAHSVRLLVEKWSAGVFTVDHTTRRVRFTCAFNGNVSERCLEFSALDRVIYNLVNNAARHTRDEEVGLCIFPVGEGEARNVRFVVTNRITAAHQAKLATMAGGDVGRLMTGGLSTTGGGLGLRICAEFMTHAFGLRSVAEVVAGGYAGTRLRDDEFVSWFHWPCAA